MDNAKLLKALVYARNNLKHPEYDLPPDYYNINYETVGGKSCQTSKTIVDQLSYRYTIVKEYEDMLSFLDDAIKELETKQ